MIILYFVEVGSVEMKESLQKKEKNDGEHE